MKTFRMLFALIISLALMLSLLACNKSSDNESSDDTNTATNTNTDTSTDSASTSTGDNTDSSTNTDVNTDTNTDVNTDTGASTNTNTDTNTNTSTSTDTNTNTDVDTNTGTNEDDGGNDENQGGESETVEMWQSSASAEMIEQAQALLESKHRLEYNEDGSFRVLILADVHMNASGDATKIQQVKDRIKELVDEVQPNLVILTGDNTINSNSEARLRLSLNAIVGYIEEKQIPWCHVYGNHDHESALDNETQQRIYQSYKYCISKDVQALSGTGTYVHGVYNKDGSLGSLVWLIDSGAYDTANGGYDYIKQDQIDWYKETSLLLKEYNDGNAVKGMMAFHIPLIENRTADSSKGDKTIVYEYDGNVNETMCPSKTDTTLLETILELGDVKLIVTGHDHKNDYMFNYKGVKLSSSPNISNLTYYDETFQGSRVIDLNAQTMDDVPTYVRYLIKRLNPSDFDILESGVVEDFNGEFADPVISGWSSGSMTGTATVEKAESMGAGGSDALLVSRDNASNFEFVIGLENIGRLGENKYLVVWIDFTNVEMRKACVGLTSKDGYENPYRTDDNDGTSPKLYYLPDGETEWIELSHGKDGCFGRDEGGNVIGYKGYFAFPIEDFRQGAKQMNEDTLVTGFYFYGSLWKSEEYLNVPFYIDNVILCKDFTELELPTE